jgi:hypothetical protein
MDLTEEERRDIIRDETIHVYNTLMAYEDIEIFTDLYLQPDLLEAFTKFQEICEDHGYTPIEVLDFAQGK